VPHRHTHTHTLEFIYISPGSSVSVLALFRRAFHCTSHLCCKHKFNAVKKYQKYFASLRVTIKRIIITISEGSALRIRSAEGLEVTETHTGTLLRTHTHVSCKNSLQLIKTKHFQLQTWREGEWGGRGVVMAGGECSCCFCIDTYKYTQCRHAYTHTYARHYVTRQLQKVQHTYVGNISGCLHRCACVSLLHTHMSAEKFASVN